VKPARLRPLALALPEASEEPHFDMTSFRVRGRIFATVPPPGEVAHVLVDEASVREAVTSAPEVYEELWWGKRLAGLRVNLAGAEEADVAELLVEAWRRRAPKRLAADYDRMASSPPG